MAVGLYADVHVPGPVIRQLRDRQVDILAATEQGTTRLADEELLRVATALNRVIVTQDIRFRVLAENWQRLGTNFAGLIFAHQRYVSFGELIQDLALISKVTESAYWMNRILQLPL
jgi:hypothetical protein